MENKTNTKTTDKVKNFFNSDTFWNIVGIFDAGVLLVGAGALCYKIGNNKGIRAGRNDILTEILNASRDEGLAMTESKLGTYIFTAKKYNG